MSKKASPKLIGAFVLGGIGLLIAGLLVFGSTNFLRERHILVSYFDGSLKGLRIGAAVTFRGVPIGQVTDIKVLFEPSRTEASIPVVFELDPSRVDRCRDRPGHLRSGRGGHLHRPWLSRPARARQPRDRPLVDQSQFLPERTARRADRPRRLRAALPRGADAALRHGEAAGERRPDRDRPVVGAQSAQHAC